MSILRTHLLKPVEAATFVKDESMADEGALLWSVRWMKPETLSDIAERYVNKCHHLGIDTFVFDKYNPSTKDVIRDST